MQASVFLVHRGRLAAFFPFAQWLSALNNWTCTCNTKAWLFVCTCSQSVGVWQRMGEMGGVCACTCVCGLACFPLTFVMQWSLCECNDLLEFCLLGCSENHTGNQGFMFLFREMQCWRWNGLFSASSESEMERGFRDLMKEDRDVREKCAAVCVRERGSVNRLEWIVVLSWIHTCTSN